MEGLGCRVKNGGRMIELKDGGWSMMAILIFKINLLFQKVLDIFLPSQVHAKGVVDGWVGEGGTTLW